MTENVVMKGMNGLKAYITDIQRFSLTDGAGIRTTVFFKGCNMSCIWCHNPETISKKRELMFYKNKCIGCGKCFEVCTEGVHTANNDKHCIDRSKCTLCGNCTDICYAGALVMCGKEMTTDDIMAQIRQDKAYYDTSGGGVTLSGGEVLCQKDFAIDLTDACHKEGIDVAVETNLCFPFEYASEILSKVDLIMCDLKLFDDSLHRQYTGVSNGVILENIKKLDTLGIPVTVRTPLIPGITDTQNNIESISSFIKDMKNLFRYEVLNFNPLGEGKYDSLDKDNACIDARPLGEDKLSDIRRILDKSGIAYKII